MSLRTLYALGLTGIVALTSLLSPSARAGSAPGISIRLVRVAFDPLAGQPELPPSLTLQAYPPGVGGAYLVQFDGPIQSAWKDDLRRLGVQLFDYIPDYAFLAWMDGATAGRAAGHPYVRWIGLYQPAYRLSPRLDGATGQQTVTLLTLPIVDEVALREQLRTMGATLHDTAFNAFGGYFRLTVEATQLPALVRLPWIVWVEPYVPPRPLNDVARGETILNAETVWQDLGLYGEGQVVGVADSGLDLGVNDATMNDDFEGRIVALYDLTGLGAADVCSGHGTHVAGSVLGNGVNSGSDSANHDYLGSYAGLAPKAQLVFQAVEFALLPPDYCYFLGIPTDLNDLFQQAYDDGARLHTNSWGGEANGEYTTQSQQTDQFAWNNKDFTILFAAGNSGTDANRDGVVDLDSMLSPATAKNPITVGGTENDRPVPAPNPDSGTYNFYFPDRFQDEPLSSDPIADDPAGIASFSSRGPTDDGRIKPDLVAPATWVLSVFSQANHPDDGGSQPDGTGDPPDRWYKYIGGTSMATPLTAGAATLARDWLNDVQGVITPTSALIKGLLINGATDVNPGEHGTGATREVPGPRPNVVEGWGRVNVADAIVPDWPRRVWYDDHTAGLSTGDVVTYTDSITSFLNVISNTEPLRVSLVWTDYAGTPPAGGLVNDLDLEVVAPDDSRYYGNGVMWDRVNNVEGVDVLTPTLGAYTLTVRAHNVAQASQPYALIVSGAFEPPECDPLTGVALQAPASVGLGDSTSFTATVTPPTATRPIHYVWAFGDGLGATGHISTTHHTYTAAGHYTATVTAANCASADPVTHTLPVAVQTPETFLYLPLVSK